MKMINLIRLSSLSQSFPVSCLMSRANSAIMVSLFLALSQVTQPICHRHKQLTIRMFRSAKIRETHIGYDTNTHGYFEQRLSKMDTVMGVVYTDKADERAFRLPSPDLILLSPMRGHSKIAIDVGRLVSVTRLGDTALPFGALSCWIMTY